MKDKNGEIITDGCTIFNKHDKDQYHQIISYDNKLCFKDGTPLTSRYRTNVFWEIIKKQVKHLLEYSIESCKVSWCPKCKDHFHNKQNRKIHKIRPDKKYYHII